jgi:hypothetical protein
MDDSEKRMTEHHTIWLAVNESFPIRRREFTRVQEDRRPAFA